MKRYLIAGILLSSALFFTACSEEKLPVEGVAKTQEIKSDNPFHFYKNVEIRPGLNFEAISWGNSSDSVGGFSVLMSDSLHNKFKAINGERSGKLVGFWNLDLDKDGNPELYLQFVKNQNQSDLMVYEFDDNEFRKISFPTLSGKTKAQYLGNDQFSIKGGELFRTIPIKGEAEGDKASEKVVQYMLQNNSFSSKEVTSP